jgi:membrane-associated protein
MMDWLNLLQIALHFDQHVGGAAAQYGGAVYVLLFLVIFVEIGFLPLFFLPGDPLLFICGALCATGAIDIWILMPVLFVATVAGSIVDYSIGKAIGHKVFTHDYRWLDKAALARTHAFYEEHGAITFLLAPFIAVVRTFAPFVAGVAEMTFVKFVLAVVAGAALWIVTLVGAGVVFGNVPLIRDHMSGIVLFGVAIGVGSLLLSGLWKWFRSRSAK